MSSGGLSTGGRAVPPEWIDYNGHMMDAYYFMAFTEATEAFLDHVGLGAAYRARTGSGIYTAESHLCFLSGVTEGAALAYRTQLLGHDAKRLHVFHLMTVAGSVVATSELMFLHVSGDRVAPMPPGAAAALAALAAGQAAVPRPDRAGRHIAMPGRALAGLIMPPVPAVIPVPRRPRRARPRPTPGPGEQPRRGRVSGRPARLRPGRPGRERRAGRRRPVGGLHGRGRLHPGPGPTVRLGGDSSGVMAGRSHGPGR